MIEGRSGGSGRGTRRELWPPPDSGSAQPTDRRFVSCTTLDPEPFPAPPSYFLPSAASSPSHLPAGHGEKFRRTERTFSSALVSAEWRAQRENDRRKERGIWAGHSKRIVGPPDSGSATSGSYVVSCIDEIGRASCRVRV